MTPFFRTIRVSFLAVIVACSVSADFPRMTALLHAQPSAQDSESKPGANSTRYEMREKHDPNGIGKFYFDREIARVMTFHGAPWLERTEREEEERLSLLIESLKLKKGDVVADIGAGSGVLTVMMAKEIGDTGSVFAVDIQQEMLDLLATKMNRLDVRNVQLVLGTEKSPKLKKASIDLAIMVDVYHEFEFPYEMMLEISAAMKPGGRVVFVEYRREDPQVPIKLVHKMSVDQVKKEMGLPEFGLRFQKTIDTLPRQHILIFERSDAAKVPGNSSEPPK